jgi:hypothetical protein
MSEVPLPGMIFCELPIEVHNALLDYHAKIAASIASWHTYVSLIEDRNATQEDRQKADNVRNQTSEEAYVAGRKFEEVMRAWKSTPGT